MYILPDIDVAFRSSQNHHCNIAHLTRLAIHLHRSRVVIGDLYRALTCIYILVCLMLLVNGIMCTCHTCRIFLLGYKTRPRHRVTARTVNLAQCRRCR
jgi:hypothetical protein